MSEKSPSHDAFNCKAHLDECINPLLEIKFEMGFEEGRNQTLAQFKEEALKIIDKFFNSHKCIGGQYCTVKMECYKAFEEEIKNIYTGGAQSTGGLTGGEVKSEETYNGVNSQKPVICKPEPLCPPANTQNLKGCEYHCGECCYRGDIKKMQKHWLQAKHPLHSLYLEETPHEKCQGNVKDA